jgi:hypothetical protein
VGVFPDHQRNRCLRYPARPWEPEARYTSRSVLSLQERDGMVVARARADAENAVIRLEVRFAHPLLRKSALWERAYDEVLRYLDPA